MKFDIYRQHKEDNDDLQGTFVFRNERNRKNCKERELIREKITDIMGGRYMRGFSYLETISIEIGSDCNLKHVHTVCPANVMKRSDKDILAME